jgi:tRNA(Ile2) C34 agmatinyltransferase TiaS
MILDTPEKEAERANYLINGRVVDRTEHLATLLLSVKETKKTLRKLNKQALCSHDFKLKQTGGRDNYKCKKCKYEFTELVGLSTT